MEEDAAKPKRKRKKNAPRLVIIDGRHDQIVLASIIEEGKFDYDKYMLPDINYTEN